MVCCSKGSLKVCSEPEMRNMKVIAALFEGLDLKGNKMAKVFVDYLKICFFSRKLGRYRWVPNGSGFCAIHCVKKCSNNVAIVLVANKILQEVIYSKKVGFVRWVYCCSAPLMPILFLSDHIAHTVARDVHQGVIWDPNIDHDVYTSVS